MNKRKKYLEVEHREKIVEKYTAKKIYSKEK